MKRSLVFAFLFVFLFLTRGLQAAPDANEPAALKEYLISLEKQSWEAWKNRDGKFFENFLSDDHVEVGFGGRSSKAEVVQIVGSPICKVQSYALDDFRMTLLDKGTALLTYREEQDTTCHTKVPSPCWVSSLYMKRGERWSNVLYQQSQIAK
ncbi:MAG: nuclear transport factor 2 family protein [Chthoniobacterales bacterium]